MGKPKMIGRINSPSDRGSKQRLRWERVNARREVKSHDPSLVMLWGGADSGCLKSAVAAGMKHKK